MTLPARWPRLRRLSKSCRETLARDFVKSHEAKAADVVTKQVLTADPNLQLGELASLLDQGQMTPTWLFSSILRRA